MSLRGSKGRKPKDELATNQTDTIYLLHDANYRELKRAASGLSSEDDASTIRLLELWSERGELYRLLDEVNRLLHNFLASARTLVDHMRVHIRTSHGGTRFEGQYQEEVEKRFIGTPVTKFVHCLRNYNLHYRIPLVDASMNVSFESAGRVKEMRHSIYLRLDVLRDWDGWDRISTQYLSQADTLPIETLADDDMGLITPFFEWFRANDLRVHRRSAGHAQK